MGVEDWPNPQSSIPFYKYNIKKYYLKCNINRKK